MNLPFCFSRLKVHARTAFSTGCKANGIPLMLFAHTTSPDAPTTTETTTVLLKSNCFRKGESRSTLWVARFFISSDVNRTVLPSLVCNRGPEKSQGSLGEAAWPRAAEASDSNAQTKRTNLIIEVDTAAG